jgi:hypothetical protein
LGKVEPNPPLRKVEPNILKSGEVVPNPPLGKVDQKTIGKGGLHHFFLKKSKAGAKKV